MLLMLFSTNFFEVWLTLNLRWPIFILENELLRKIEKNILNIESWLNFELLSNLTINKPRWIGSRPKDHLTAQVLQKQRKKSSTFATMLKSYRMTFQTTFQMTFYPTVRMTFQPTGSSLPTFSKCRSCVLFQKHESRHLSGNFFHRFRKNFDFSIKKMQNL